MKVEQQSTEGVAGILSSIDESGPIGLSHGSCKNNVKLQNINQCLATCIMAFFCHIHADLVGDENELCTPTSGNVEP